MHRSDAAKFQPQQFPFVLSDNVLDVFDGGREFNHGNPPDEIDFNGAKVSNPRKQSVPQSMLGVAQKAWFVEKLRASSAPWKVWGNSVGMLEWRIDFQNLPEGVGPKWPDSGYATFIDDDWSAYRHERSEILELIRSKQITGVVAICGDRHAFEAGLVSGSIPEFVTGSISAPGLFEAAEYSLPKDHPLRAIYLHQSSAEAPVRPAVNFSMMHGVRAGLALTRTGDVRQAVAERNPQVAPHLSFVDLSGHGYSLVRASSDQLEVEFVCIVRPLERSERADGGPLAYRVTHRVKRWTHEATPKIERTKVEGILPVVL
jgi:alkaline phosphatase D